MKLRLTVIDWEYPKNGKIPEPELLDLSSRNNDELTSLYLSFANGVIIEMKIEGDSEEAIKLIQRLALGAGSCKLIDMLSNEEKERLWLYEEEYECYRQGSSPEAGYIFVNPKPQPDILAAR